MKVFAGNGNPGLARAICRYLHIPMGEWKLTRFSDGEVYCQILENVRGTDVFFAVACGSLMLGCLGFLIPFWVAPLVELPDLWFEVSMFLGLMGAILIVPAIDLVGDGHE
jgi:hypothetical protein